MPWQATVEPSFGFTSLYVHVPSVELDLDTYTPQDFLPPDPPYTGFPEPALMSELFDNYFRTIHASFPLLHRPTFLRAVGAGQHRAEEGFGAVVLLVCALGARFSNNPATLLAGLFYELIFNDSQRCTSSFPSFFVLLRETDLMVCDGGCSRELAVDGGDECDGGDGAAQGPGGPARACGWCAVAARLVAVGREGGRVGGDGGGDDGSCSFISYCHGYYVSRSLSID